MPEEVYERLNSQFRIREQTGAINFELGNVSIIVKSAMPR